MTIPTANIRMDYAGNGSAVTFPYTYKAFANTDLRVLLTEDATGVPVPQTLTTHYTVSGVGSESGGNVVMVTAPPVGYTLTILATIANTQTTDLVNETRFYQSRIEDRMDKLCRADQVQAEKQSRSMVLPESEAGNPTLTTLPPLAERKGKNLSFDAMTAQPTASSPASAAVSAAMEPVVGSATLALARAAMGPWNGISVGVINVKDPVYGAVGDGVVDDSAAIQSAIDACKAAGGGVVFFPFGRYRCASRLKAQNTTAGNVYVCFAGQGSGNANVPANMHGSILVGDTGGILLDMAGCSNFYGCNFGIASGVISPSTIGMLFQRTASDSYCQEVKLDRVNIGLASAPAANDGLGSISLVNKRGEHHHYSDCKFTADTPELMDGNSVYPTIVSPDYAEATPGGASLQLNQFDNCEFIAITYDCIVMRSPGGVLMNNPYFGAPTSRAGIVAAFVNGMRIINGLMEPSSGNPSKAVSLVGNCWNWNIEMKSAVPGLVGIDGVTAGAALTNFTARFIGNFGHVLTGNFYQGDLWFSSVTDGHTMNLTDGAGTVEKHDRDQTSMVWTPVVRFGGASVGVTYGAARRGTYTRCKNRIIAQCNIPLTSKGSSVGALTIAGLPFTSNNASGFNQAANLVVNTMAAGITAPPIAIIQANAQVIDVFKMAAGSLASVTDTDCTNTTALILTITYEI